jgi:hypothetical protein
MKLYTIPGTWSVFGNVVISAESLEDAILDAEDAPLPIDNSYIDGSFRVDHEAIESRN